MNDQNSHNRALFGIHIIVNDGDEDATVRPTRLDKSLIERMREVPPAPRNKGDIPSEYLYGVHIRVEGENEVEPT